MRRVLAFICVVFVIVCFTVIQIIKIPPPDFSAWEWEQIILTGEVVGKEVRTNERGETLLVKLLPLKRAGEEAYASPESDGKVLCYVNDLSFEPKMGSIIKITGKLSAFERASNPGQFSAAEFYQILKTDYRLYNAEILAFSTEYSNYRETLYQIKKILALTLDEYFSPENASILRTMLLGERSQADAEIKALYQRNGIVHILTISGLHISIIGLTFYKLLRKVALPVYIAAPAAVIIMYSYGVMTEMGASSIRAIVMFSLRMAAGLLKRTYDLLTALAVAALLLLIDQPLYLFHSGFLFSFLAVLAIGLFIPVMNSQTAEGNKKPPPDTAGRRRGLINRLTFVRQRLKRKYPLLKYFSPLTKLKNAALSGFLISTFHLPVYFTFYYEFPLYSILLNLIVIPLMSLLMISGIMTMLFGLIFIPAAKITAVISNLILAFYERACLFFDELPYNRLILGKPDIWQLLIFIGIIILLLFIYKKIKQPVRYAIYLTGIIILLIRFPGDLTITFLDVGQGDGIFIATPDRRHFLIDGGSTSVTKVGEYRILPFLKSQGVARLDAWLISHPDLDHYSAFPELVDKIGRGGVKISSLILPDIDAESKNENYLYLVDIAKEAEIAVMYIGQGQSVTFGKRDEITLYCLHPISGSYWPPKDTNAYSVNLLLEYGGFSLLLTGDVEGLGERELKRYIEENGVAYDTTILKVSHHGSRNSTDEAFLNLTNPTYAVISAGRNNLYGHPHRELLERLANAGAVTYITFESGAVTVKTDGNRMKIEEFLR